jgi:hypothetical protein
MTVEQLPKQMRLADHFSHIDMDFFSRKLAITALGSIR